MSTRASSIAIACESGGFRCVFVHGVLAALERAGVRPVAFSAASASVLPAAFAAIGRARDPGVGYWHEALEVRMRPGNGMSEMVTAGLESYGPLVESELFAEDRPRFIVATSAVVDEEAAVATQGELATRVGRAQLLAMAKGDETWASASLAPAMFDTAAEGALRLDRARFREVSYASSRMLHAWRIPATVDARPYIDASYTVGFPVRELAGCGADGIIAIATGADGAFRNLYRREPIAREVDGATVALIAPVGDLRELGVDFTTASDEGLERAWRAGEEAAARWLERVG